MGGFSSKVGVLTSLLRKADFSTGILIDASVIEAPQTGFGVGCSHGISEVSRFVVGMYTPNVMPLGHQPRGLVDHFLTRHNLFSTQR
ncbi:hypothetical protein JIR001_11200 [Polycladomyces abyssicola]|uniref:Uncharacterized protein n=1 Tax=Polycladomyces abyssicola TaxID=1125966 RepID=A0A8D5UG35_9BACL|nr:hypothetical protein JIR001_11200 [Polycladomyces abyssicola]